MKFDVEPVELAHVVDIVDRAEALGLMRPPVKRSDVVMSLCACHANGCPLDFARMAEGPDFDLAHDVLGIWQHVDRTTGQLGNCFLPRYAMPTPSAPPTG